MWMSGCGRGYVVVDMGGCTCVCVCVRVGEWMRVRVCGCRCGLVYMCVCVYVTVWACGCGHFSRLQISFIGEEIPYVDIDSGGQGNAISEVLHGLPKRRVL